MSLSVPNNPLSVNPGVNNGAVDPTPVLQSRTLINQVRGVTQSGSTGSGIPKAVTNVQASISNAAQGTTSVVNVQFRRDPSDKAYSRVLIFAQGYQGNNTPVQVGSSTDSPATLVVNNTGEAITVIVQASGNGGAVPLAQCPSVGVQLPKSAAGGVGTNTKTSTPATSGSASAGQLAKFANPATTLTGADLSGDVATSGSTAATVVGIRGKPVLNNAPIVGDNLWFDGANWGPNWFPHIKGQTYEYSAGAFYTIGQTLGQQLSSSSTDTAPTATEPGSFKQLTGATAGTTPYGYSQNVDGVVLGLLKRYTARMRANNLTLARYWVGFTSKTSPLSANTLISDFPTAISMCAFRYSAGTDTNWQAITSNGSSQTIVNTGVPPDSTNSQLFEIAWDGTTVRFYINRALVGSSTTNLPSTSVLMPYVSIVDNKSAANQVSIQNYYTYYQEK